MANNVLGRLQEDPGNLTLGRLLQDREAAAHEINELRGRIDRLEIAMAKRTSTQTAHAADRPRQDTSPLLPGSLLRLSEVCRFFGISRSTIYVRMAAANFPKPLRLGARMVRWRLEALEAWRDAHASS